MEAAAEEMGILAALAAIDTGTCSSSLAGQDPGWTALARRLPPELRAVLIDELRAGNAILGIGSAAWPVEGSVVVNMRDRFSSSKRTLSPVVRWRELNDPHYCREEFSQTYAGIEHLLIT